MKLKEFIKHITDLTAKDPSLLDCTVIYGVDDEGNGYREVEIEPTICQFSGNDILTDNDIDDFIADAVCIN